MSLCMYVSRSKYMHVCMYEGSVRVRDRRRHRRAHVGAQGRGRGHCMRGEHRRLCGTRQLRCHSRCDYYVCVFVCTYVCMYVCMPSMGGKKGAKYRNGRLAYMQYMLYSVFIYVSIYVYVCMYVVLRSHLHEPRGGHSGADGGAVAESGHRIQQGRVPILCQL
jgi:hypothetical protein